MNPEVSGGGQLMDQGMHVLDLVRWFLGDFSEAFGLLQTGFWDIAPNVIESVKLGSSQAVYNLKR
ncbi:hypothetical protein ACFLUS_05960 [Chloroflexota bacterium]